jgi:hypothetical protein
MFLVSLLDIFHGESKSDDFVMEAGPTAGPGGVLQWP